MNLPEGNLPAKALVLDREFVREVYALRTRHGNPPHDEVWAGALVLNPLPDNEHRRLCLEFALAFRACTGDDVLIGANVAGDSLDWLHDFRCPDVVVYLASNPAKDCDTHWVGGPDLVVEVVSPGEDPLLKLDFYSKVNVRELLIVERDPWAIEQYALQNGKLVLVGTATAANGAVLTSGVLPLTLQLVPGAARPAIRIAHTATGQTWTA